MTQNDVFQRPIASSFLLLLGCIILGLVIGTLVGQIIAANIVGIQLTDFQKLINTPANYPNAWMALLVMQGISALIGFVGASWVYITLFERKNISSLLPSIQPAQLSLLIILLTITAFPFNGWVIQWNQSIHFPDGIDEYFRSEEKKLAILTKFLTDFHETWQLLLAIFVMAFIPAIGEELLFRGILQNLISRGIRNVHAAVWISAFVFSAVHLQFFGFVPRLLLGALLGYLYAWTGSLRAPMLAHFVNNSATLLIVYFFRTKISFLEGDAQPHVPVLGAIVSFLFVIGLMIQIRKITTETNATNPTA